MAARLYLDDGSSARLGRSRVAAAALAFLLCLVCPAGRASAEAPETVSARWRLVSQPVGERGETRLALEVLVESGWHVNANDPDRPYLIPTELTLDAVVGTAVESIRYPDAVVRALAFAGEQPLRLYEGTFAIDVTLSGAVPKRVDGRLRYQACNDRTCLPPRTLPVALTLGGEQAGGAAAGAGAGGAFTSGDASSFERWIGEHGLLATLALVALFGLGLNLTPCVYPLVSVTIAYFGSQSGATTGRVLALASAYALGIAVTFSVLGVVAALSGGLFGAALQQPLVLVGIAVLMVALAASNFGLYQVRLPSALVQRAGRASTGVGGALAMGLTMGVVAAPCVGPIVIALLLFVAARQDALLGFALFFALAVGMGAPYVGLAAAAGSLQRLPRSGEWLGWIERLFGFVLLGMALYFVAPLVGDGVLAVGLPALVAAAAFYLGFVDASGRTLPAFLAVKRAVGVLGIVAAAWLALPRGVESAIAWQPFEPGALGAARSAGRPAIVDFTATWCLPCRENDRYTFADAAVGAEADRFVMLRADVTEMTAEVEKWMQSYEVLGVPTIVFFGADGKEATRVVGFVEPERFLALMREAT
jgi:thiol:disulfide interchange protein DsbD